MTRAHLWSAFKRRHLSQEPSYTEVITDAVADLLEHGYDSQERINRWVEAIRIAAQRDMVSEAALTTMLRRILGATYEREVGRGKMLQQHPGVSRYTLQQVASDLRLELDRRIAASAELIRSNRRESIDRTLHRFQGWATSIPQGGAPKAGRAEVKAELRGALSSLPFAERRVIIDQGHKLASNLNLVVARGGGAIAMVWRSNWRQVGYNYRPDHKERDGEVYTIRGNWAQQQGLMKPGEAGYLDAITQPAQEPFCRCYGRYLYTLSDLPPEMITQTGRDAMANVAAAQVRTA